jgi:hypothetical protein
VPDSVSHRFTDRLTVLTEPAGARVRVWRFEPDALDSDTVWHELGRAPLRGIAVARGDYYLSIEADGYATVERIASSAGSRALDLPGAAEVQLEARLLPADRVPEEMVYVPGGFYRIASSDLQSLSTGLDAFFIDRFEVTNVRFAAFVDADGYARAEHWSDLADVEGAAAGEMRQRIRRSHRPARAAPVERAATATRDRGASRHRRELVRGGRVLPVPGRRAADAVRVGEGRARRRRIGPRASSCPGAMSARDDPGADRANLAGTGTTPSAPTRSA